jgi:hypothetical protein
VIVYATAPTTGKKMMRRAHRAFAPPEWSVRRKLSIINRMTHVMNMIHAKKMIIVQIASQNV